MLARFQLGLNEVDGRCGVLLTYPMKGHPWRRNPVKSVELRISDEEKAQLFAEVKRLKTEHPGECLAQDQLWNDSSEKANGITRDRSTGTLCHTIGIRDGEPWEEYFSMREDSEALLSSFLYQTISRLIAPYERLDGMGPR